MNKLVKNAFLCLSLISVLATWSCNEIECSFEGDQKVITDYLAANGLTAQKSETGLHYIIQEDGKGSLYPNSNSIVTVNYKGYFPDGSIFDESDTAIQFPVSGVIVGWQEGLRLMKKESKAQFFIPSSLAYGTRQVGGKAGSECSVIIFDVELIDFE